MARYHGSVRGKPGRTSDDEDPRPPILPVLAHYGVDVPEGRREASFCCPAHGERRPSASVNADRGLFICFACDARGDAVKLIQIMETCSRAEALERLEAICKAAGVEMKQSVRGRYQRPSEGRTATPGRRYVPPGRRSA